MRFVSSRGGRPAWTHPVTQRRNQPQSAKAWPLDARPRRVRTPLTGRARRCQCDPTSRSVGRRPGRVLAPASDARRRPADGGPARPAAALRGGARAPASGQRHDHRVTPPPARRCPEQHGDDAVGAALPRAVQVSQSMSTAALLLSESAPRTLGAAHRQFPVRAAPVERGDRAAGRPARVPGTVGPRPSVRCVPFSSAPPPFPPAAPAGVPAGLAPGGAARARRRRPAALPPGDDRRPRARRWPRSPSSSSTWRPPAARPRTARSPRSAR